MVMTTVLDQVLAWALARALVQALVLVMGLVVVLVLGHVVKPVMDRETEQEVRGVKLVDGEVRRCQFQHLSGRENGL